MNSYDSSKVINGTFGEIWINDEYITEVIGLEAKSSLNVEEVKQCQKLEVGYKVVGSSGSGTIKTNKVRSTIAKKILQGINEGKPYRAKIISNLADPDAFGSERVEFQDCIFTEVSLANWEAGTLGEESFPFSYGKANFLDSIDV